jgi:hypothetical protein
MFLVVDTADDWSDEEGRSEAEPGDFQAQSPISTFSAMPTKEI